MQMEMFRSLAAPENEGNGKCRGKYESKKIQKMKKILHWLMKTKQKETEKQRE